MNFTFCLTVFAIATLVGMNCKVHGSAQRCDNADSIKEQILTKSSWEPTLKAAIHDLRKKQSHQVLALTGCLEDADAVSANLFEVLLEPELDSKIQINSKQRAYGSLYQVSTEVYLGTADISHIRSRLQELKNGRKWQSWKGLLLWPCLIVVSTILLNIVDRATNGDRRVTLTIVLASCWIAVLTCAKTILPVIG